MTSPDMITVHDIATGDTVTTFTLNTDDGFARFGCFSPDQRFIAISSASGGAFLGDTQNGSLVELPTGIQEWKSLGWTSPDQLVYIINTEGETLVQTYNITTGQTHNIAALQSLGGWFLTASGTMC